MRRLDYDGAVEPEIRIGTSGWHYRHWIGPFYPPKLPSSKMLQYYFDQFDTVEINNSFYRLPPENALATWRESTPPGFVFAVKGSRFLTHMKKLNQPEIGLERFFQRADLLRDKLGPVLFQLPPNWELDLDRFRHFLNVLPNGHRYAFEFRNPTWHVPEVYRELERHNAADCAFDLAGFQSPIRITADFTYVRLHGPGGKYQGSYSDRVLEDWAGRIRRWRKELRAIYIYFDNDQAAYAVRNAKTLRELVR